MKILIQSNVLSVLDLKTNVVSYYKKLSHINDQKLRLSKIKLRSEFVEEKDNSGLNPKEILNNFIN